MINISIDPRQKTISIVVDVVGESEPVELKVEKYSIEGSQISLKIKDIHINKEWVNILAGKFLTDLEFDLPIDFVDYIGILK